MKANKIKTGALPHSAGFPGTNKVKPPMKVFKFFSDEYFYAFSGRTEPEAKEALFEFVGEMPIDKVEEIPEAKWDEKNIECHEDNDTEKPAFFISIRDELYLNEPTLIFTNDHSIF